MLLIDALVSTATALHVAEEVAIWRHHDRRVGVDRRVVGAHGAVERGEFRVAAVGAGEDAGAFAFTFTAEPLAFLARGGENDGGVAGAFGADAAGDSLTLRAHVFVHPFRVLGRQVGLTNADIDHTHAEFGGGGAVEVVLDRLHQSGAAAG